MLTTRWVMARLIDVNVFEQGALVLMIQRSALEDAENKLEAITNIERSIREQGQ